MPGVSALPEMPVDAARRPDFRGLDLMRRPIWVLDPLAPRMLHANPAALVLWRAESLTDFLARDISAVSASMRARTEATLARLRRGEVVRERCTFYPRGAPAAVDCLISGLRRADGAVVMLIEASELEIAPSELRAFEALRHTGALVTLFDEEGRPLFRNPAALLAYPDASCAVAPGGPPDGSPDGSPGGPPGEAPAFAARFAAPDEAAALWRVVLATGTAEATVRVRTAAGPRWHALAARTTPDPASGATSVLVSEQDVTAEIEARARVEHMATHDPLTDLANRTLLRRRLDEVLRDAAARNRPHAALLCLDLDRFKAVNDAWGHAAGDALLCGVARRLRDEVGARPATVARLGGDEFAVLLPNGLEATPLAERLVVSLCQPFALSEGPAEIGASIGVAFSAADSTPDGLSRAADTALYRAKAAGRGVVRVFGREGADASPSPPPTVRAGPSPARLHA